MLESLFSKLYSKETPTQLFSCGYCEFLRIAIFMKHLWWLLECRVITLKRVQVASAVFLRCSFRKIFLYFWSTEKRISTAESDLSRVKPVTLLLSLSVMDNFLEILQELKKNGFQYKQRQVIVSQAYKSRRYVCGGGVISSFF